MSYSLARRASTNIPLEEATRAVDRGFAAWMNAVCPGGGSPQVEVSNFGPVSCDQHEYNPNGGNANIVSFREEDWPYEGLGTAVALTTLTYNVETGIIYDADLELNAHGATLTTSDKDVQFDVQSIVAHEAGHFLGIAHSTDVDATMYPDYSAGTIGLRVLSSDDVRAICAAYPPSSPLPSRCDPTPRHGFSGECGGALSSEDPGACCSVAPGAVSARGSLGPQALIASVLGLCALGLRRRRRA